MGGWTIALTAAILIGYAAFSRRLTGALITAAMVFVVAGYALGTNGLDALRTGLTPGGIRVLAEATLALVLFTDAADLDTRALTRESSVPLRLLGIGLPLTIIIGTLVALPLFPGLGLFEALILAVLLAPTDAALGQAVVSDERLPSPIRQGLNVESGLNDGICVPLLFAALAMAELDERRTFNGRIVIDLVKEVGIATLVGVAVALICGTVLVHATRRGWMEPHWQQVVPLAAAALAYVSTDKLGGSGFIACFVAGLLYGRVVGRHAHETTVFAEEVGQVLSACTFFTFGAIVIAEAIPHLDFATVLYAVLSLTLVRMLPVAIALVGSGAARPTMAFAGWFGPRGLATIVFMLTIVEESGLHGTPRIVQVATFTVVLSIFAHGITALPLTARYARWFSSQSGGLTMETAEVTTQVKPRGLARRTPRGATTEPPRES